MPNPKNFVLIGAAGFVAPRHMKAIRETDNLLLGAVDPSDSVGIIDSYFPDAAFFTEFERFDRFVEMLRSDRDRRIDYVSICSPNYLHDAHIRFALRSDATPICEKPLVINPWNLDALARVEERTGRKVNSILQLRLHPSLRNFHAARAARAPSGKKAEVDLTYITSRGQWYLYSWKGDARKSGGVVMNIGIHFFDMLMWLFGPVEAHAVHHADDKTAAGYLELQDARVRWFLSIDAATLPEAAREKGQRTWRSITVDGEELEFSGGFTDLHTLSYAAILNGEGFGLDAVRPSIELVYEIRQMDPSGPTADCHPFLHKVAPGG